MYSSCGPLFYDLCFCIILPTVMMKITSPQKGQHQSKHSSQPMITFFWQVMSCGKANDDAKPAKEMVGPSPRDKAPWLESNWGCCKYVVWCNHSAPNKKGGVFLWKRCFTPLSTDIGVMLIYHQASLVVLVCHMVHWSDQLKCALIDDEKQMVCPIIWQVFSVPLQHQELHSVMYIKTKKNLC